MEANRLIRDVYTFKRGFPAPVVKLETMDRRNCYEERQRQASLVPNIPHLCFCLRY